MDSMDRKKSGMISIEHIFGILFAVLVLFLVIGVLDDNLDKMAANSNFTRIVSENRTRTNYTSFGRNYSYSQIYVK